MKNNTRNEWLHQGAFVIQFRSDTDLEAGVCSGRVEHVASFECTHFNSLDEVLAFVSRTLARVRIEPRQLSEIVSASEECDVKPVKAE